MNRLLYNFRKIFKYPLTYIILISIIIQNIFYSFFPVFLKGSDTNSYTTLFRGNILKGILDEGRTPIYPYFFKIVNYFSGSLDNTFTIMAFIQKILFFISIILFFLTVKKLFKSKYIQFIISLIYAICPFLFMWNIFILTECFSIFQIVLLFYLTISYIKNPNSKYPIFISIHLFIMVMTRPASIYLYGAYLVFWILKLLTEKSKVFIKYIKYGLISLFVTIIFIFAYMYQFKNQFGMFSISRISDINNIVMVINSGIYTKGNNKEIIKDIDSVLKSDIEVPIWIAADHVRYNYSITEKKEYLDSCKKNGFKQYIYYLGDKVLNVGSYNIGRVDSFVYDLKVDYIVNYLCWNIFPITFSDIYYLLAISFIYLLIKLIKKKEIDWVVAALFCFIFGNFFLTIFFAPFDWQRLVVTSIPMTIILIPYLFIELYNSFYKKNTNAVKGRTKKGIIRR